MTESIFSRIYSYRESENKNSKENFLIEIFAFCLENDTQFLKDFLESLEINYFPLKSIKTQSSYELGRPDIEINLGDNNTCILIECKVENVERENQLEDYRTILLNKKVKEKHLIYLTKYYEARELNDIKVHFHLTRWSNIFNLITDNSYQITKQFKTYIKEEDMSDSKNFSYQDIVAMQNVAGTIKKMDEVLDSIKPFYEKKFGKLSKDSSRSTRLKDSWYINYHSIHNPEYVYEIAVGFMWWWEDEEVRIGVRLWIPRSDKFPKSDYYWGLFTNHLKDWDSTEYDSGYEIEKTIPVAQFIINDEEQILEMVKELQSILEELYSVKLKDKKIFS